MVKKNLLLIFFFIRDSTNFGVFFIVLNVNAIVVLNYIWWITLIELGYNRIVNKDTAWNIKKYGEGIKEEKDEDLKGN